MEVAARALHCPCLSSSDRPSPENCPHSKSGGDRHLQTLHVDSFPTKLCRRSLGRGNGERKLPSSIPHPQPEVQEAQPG